MKLILYCNFAAIKSKRKTHQHIPVLKLTAVKIKGSINSKQTQQEINAFLKGNDFTTTQITLIEKLFEEATKNNFLVKIEHAN